MPLRSPKRVYSPAALERWFELLTDPWEHHFRPDELEKGRILYREGEVRELDMDEGTIIVHSRQGRSDVYAVIEWEDASPSVRSGISDKKEGRVLAAAGLYEVEELLSVELPAIPPEKTETKAVEAPVDEPVEQAREPEVRPHLKVRLSPTPQGVRLQAFWLKELREIPALGAIANGEPQPDEAEREMIIRLTTRARQAGFNFRASKGDFVLSDVSRIPAFLRTDLAKWRKSFDVEKDPRLDVFSEGVREVKIEASARQRSKGVELSWSAYIDGKVLERTQVQRLLRKAGQVVISPEEGLLKIEAKQAPDLAELYGTLDTPEGELPRYLLFSLFQRDQIPVELSGDLQEWRRTVLHPPPANGGLPDFLRPYQKRGVAWMRHLSANGCHCLLADEMGLGKTVQVLSLLNAEMPWRLSSLIVCPASVVPVWRSEAARFFPQMRVRTLQSGDDWSSDSQPSLWIASYTQLRRHRHILAGHSFAYAVLDEAQFIKNPDAKVTQACLAIKADRRIAVTGTPLENWELDIWTIFRFLMPGILGTRKRLEEQVEKDPDALREKLRKQVAPFILRRTKTEVASELPPKVEAVLNCPLTPLQEREYKQLAREGLEALGEDINATLKDRSISFFALLTRLRQACCDPGLLPWQECPPEQSGKILALLDKLQEPVAQGGRRAVVFSQFTTLLKRVQQALNKEFPSLPVQILTGQTTNRAKPVEEFQKGSGAGVILVSLKAGGTGITLNAADYVFLMDPWWNPAVEAQAIDRVHRIGQDKTVFVYRMIAPGTVEERVEQLKSEKKELFDSTVGRVADMTSFGNHFKSFSELIGSRPTSE